MSETDSTPPPRVPQQGPPPPPGNPPPREWNAGTRYMCAGTHLDESFARTVVAELRHEKFRACAPSYGVDLRQVALHADRALRAVRTRDTGISVCFALAFLCMPAVAVFYTLASKLFALGAGAVPSLPGARRLRQRRDGHTELEVAATPLRRLLGGLFRQALTLLACAGFGTPLLWGVTDPAWAFLLGLLLLILGPWLFAWQQQTRVWETLTDELGPDSDGTGAGGTVSQYDPASGEYRAESDLGLPGSATGGEGNLVVHSGYLPFVGAGTEVDSWSFGMRLLPEGYEPGSEEPRSPLPVDTGLLVTTLRDRLAELRTDGVAVDSMRGLRVSEKVFVDGTELQTDEVLGRESYWPGHPAGGGPPRRRPADSVPPELVRRVRGRLDGPVRHSLCAEVRSWDADVVLSLFLQAAVSGDTLYLQSDTYVLAPVRDGYRQADALTERHAEGSDVRLSADALHVAHRAMGAPVARAVRLVMEPYRLAKRERNQAELIAHNRCYDFGAWRSLRELASSDMYNSFFQRVDVSRNSKQIQLTTFAALTDLLARHGLDTGELLERRNTILNNGIMMTGGSVTGSLAAGTGARAVSGPADSGPNGAGGGSGGRSGGS